MGFDKALIRVAGVPLAVRIAQLARELTNPVLEVGPGYSGCATAPESQPGAGPLAALADGVSALRAVGFSGPALVLSTDLAMLDAPTLAALVTWPGTRSIVPMLDGQPQPLCARWSAADLDAAAALVAAGERSLRPLLARAGVELTDAIDPCGLRDADTPEDLTALALDWCRP